MDYTHLYRSGPEQCQHDSRDIEATSQFNPQKHPRKLHGRNCDSLLITTFCDIPIVSHVDCTHTLEVSDIAPSPTFRHSLNLGSNFYDYSTGHIITPSTPPASFILTEKVGFEPETREHFSLRFRLSQGSDVGDPSGTLFNIPHTSPYQYSTLISSKKNLPLPKKTLLPLHPGALRPGFMGPSNVHCQDLCFPSSTKECFGAGCSPVFA